MNPPDAMSPARQSWLQERITALRRQWFALDFPRAAGLIHGDAHIGNLMCAASGQAVLGDWDHVGTGPREWDLAQIHYMGRRFDRAGKNGIDAFAAAYGSDIRTRPGLDTRIAIREIWGLRPYIRTGCPAPSSPGSSTPSARKASWTWPPGRPTARATVVTALGYADATGVRVFQGTVDGSLATEPRGTSGFGYDAIFIPGSDGSHRTYAQMTSEEKNKISHRRRAVEAMRDGLGLR